MYTQRVVFAINYGINKTIRVYICCQTRLIGLNTILKTTSCTYEIRRVVECWWNKRLFTQYSNSSQVTGAVKYYIKNRIS